MIISALGPAQAERALPEYKSLGELPRPVTEAFKPVADGCEWHINQLIVRRFGDDLLYAVRCASNHANQIYAYVIAKDAEGTGATLLLFPQPKQKKPLEPLDSISNAELDGEKSEITHEFIDPEQPPCRVQAAWRIEGTKPQLIHWREARHCKGEGWVVKVDQRKKR